MKVILECVVDVQGDERITGLDLKLERGSGKWEPALLVAFKRKQRVRDGKHLLISDAFTTVVHRGGPHTDDELYSNSG